MSEQLGKLVTCTRCNNTVFLKCTGEVGGSNYTDPGYRRTAYEELPTTWLNLTPDIGHLCPECAKQMTHLLVDFFGQDVYDKFAWRWKIKEQD